MIFLDTTFFINLYVETNEFHSRAKEIWNNIEDEELIISDLIITEVITVLNVKLKQNKELLSYAYDELINKFGIVEDNEFYVKAMEKVLNYYPERIPFFDCVYMSLMEDLGIKKIVSFDEHFDNKENLIRIH